MSTALVSSSVALIVVGLVVCLFGYRLVRFTLAVAGFGVGFALGQLVGFIRPGVSPALALVIELLLGIFGAVAAILLYRPGVFLLGAAVGALIAGLIFVYAQWQYLLLACVITAVAGGVLTLLFQRQLISVLSAVAGGWGVVFGTLRLVGWLPPHAGSRNASAVYIVMALGWAALSVIGAVVQLRGRAGRAVSSQ